MKAQFAMTGGAAIEEILKGLPLNVQREIGLKATKEGAQVILEDARARARVRTGRMFNAIDITTALGSKNSISVDLGVMRGAKRGDKKGAWYAHIVEFGSKFKAARPFMRPALDSKAGEAVRLTGEALWKYIDKFVASGRRK